MFPAGHEPGLAFVRVIAPGRELSMTRGRPESFVLRDGEAELGPINADLHMFLIELDGVEHIVYAGPQASEDHALTVVDDHPYPVKNGAWLSIPAPFKPGAPITAIWQDNDGAELFRLASPPLEPESLQPLFGPAWTGYGPSA